MSILYSFWDDGVGCIGISLLRHIGEYAIDLDMSILLSKLYHSGICYAVKLPLCADVKRIDLLITNQLSVNNGFILSPTYDRLFDTGLISFENTGKIVLSHLLTSADKEKLLLASGSVYDIQSNPELNHNLEYHRDVVFIK